MAEVLLHSPAEGNRSGETVTVSADRAAWLVAEGYASDPSAEPVDHTNGTSTPASQDPRLAENREAPGERPPRADRADNAPEVSVENPHRTRGTTAPKPLDEPRPSPQPVTPREHRDVEEQDTERDREVEQPGGSA